MKQLLTALVFLVSTQSMVLAVDPLAHSGLGVAVPLATSKKPIVPADPKLSEKAQWVKAINACVLEQGALPTAQPEADVALSDAFAARGR